MLMLVALPVLLLDQLSKHLISSSFELYQTRPLIPGWLDLTYTLNPGAAFSLFATMPEGFRHLFFVVLSIVAIVVSVASAVCTRTTAMATKGVHAIERERWLDKRRPRCSVKPAVSLWVPAVSWRES